MPSSSPWPATVASSPDGVIGNGSHRRDRFVVSQHKVRSFDGRHLHSDPLTFYKMP
jgi:hypothetical protein